MMTIRAKVQPISRDIELMISELLSPEAQSRHLADFARDARDDALATNLAVLGRETPYESFVDNRPSDDLDAVRPNGTIAFEFELYGEVLEWIGEQLVRNSPVLTGTYANSHMLFSDGNEVTGEGSSGPGEYTFISTLPYSRKLERGLSPQAPDGIYQSVAAIANGRFSNLAKITFTYRGVVGMTVVNQDLAASSGKSWWLGHSGAARNASGEAERRVGGQFGRFAHNQGNVRFPAIVVRF